MHRLPPRRISRRQQRTDAPSSGPRLVERSPDGVPRLVVLLLHGGKVNGLAPVRTGSLSVARMVALGRALHRAGRRHGVAVFSLRHRVQGWNGGMASPVADARWALAQIAQAHPGLPIVLVGHSMGGRTAMRVADDAGVQTVVGLAPWLPAGEGVETLRGRRVIIIHGLLDRTTSPGLSRDFLRRAAGVAAEVEMIELRRAGHYMLRRISLWHRLTAAAVLPTQRVNPAQPL